ncbi:hypothetical protein VULLAG_LOCUS9327 [Vulpes lagopus]
MNRRMQQHPFKAKGHHIRGLFKRGVWRRGDEMAKTRIAEAQPPVLGGDAALLFHLKISIHLCKNKSRKLFFPGLCLKVSGAPPHLPHQSATSSPSRHVMPWTGQVRGRQARSPGGAGGRSRLPAAGMCPPRRTCAGGTPPLPSPPAPP